MIYLEARYLPGSHGYYRLGGGWWKVTDTAWITVAKRLIEQFRKSMRGKAEFRIVEE